MIYLKNLSKAYGKKDLFLKISLSINRGEKIGLIGPNGAGKSTLFSIILGQTEASSGEAQLNRGLRVGYLPQEAKFESKISLLAELTEGDEKIMSLKREKETLEAQGKAGLARYGKVLHDLEFMGYFDLEHKAKKVLAGLGFKNSDFGRPIEHLSGGFKMRVLLAKLLVFNYDVLLLDEPTNFLDLEAALWFKEYLNKFKGTFVMISHDKDFLTGVTNFTLVLENGSISKIKGNYDDYELAQAIRRDLLRRQFREQEKKRKQLQMFVSRFHAQPNKASQVRAKKRVLEKMERIIVPRDRRESIRKFNFPQGPKSGYQVMALEKISKSYGDIKVYEDFDFEITKGEKAVFVGPNGAGKSTLLKILAGVLDVDSGRRVLGHKVTAGYFSQTRMDVLNSEDTVFEEAYQASGGRLKPEEMRTLLAAFLFIGDDVEKRVRVLSGGEKSRLILAKLLINPPNFLLLDEPTTHLDVDAVDALIKALSDYEGTLVFISHDIHFVRSVANIVFEVKNARVRKFPGNFDYYWQKAKQEPSEGRIDSPAAITKDVRREDDPGNKNALDREEKKRIKANNARISKRIKSLRKEEEDLKLDQNVKARVLANPRSYHNTEMVTQYGRRLKEIEKRLAEITEEINKLKGEFIIPPR
jgi:ATP-binding cassette subfamily F protein 3